MIRGMRRWLHDLAYSQAPGQPLAAMRIVISLIWLFELLSL